MKSKVFVFLFIGVLCAGTARAQSLTPIVVASSGGYFTSGSGSISATIAEMTMIQTFESTGAFITQGFQQPAELYLSIDEDHALHFGVFPNPTSGKFSVTFDASENSVVLFKLYSTDGNVVLSQQVSTGFNQLDLDIGVFDAGIYLLEYTQINSSGKTETGIVKINLTHD